MSYVAIVAQGTQSAYHISEKYAILEVAQPMLSYPSLIVLHVNLVGMQIYRLVAWLLPFARPLDVMVSIPSQI